MRTWRINGLAPTVGLRRWQDGLAAAFVRLDVEGVGPEGFSGRIEQARLPGGRISRVSATAHRVIRRDEHVARNGRDVVFANLQVSGRGEVAMRGAPHQTAPMDLSIVPATERYAITHSDPFELISFALPRRALPPALRPGCLRLSQSAAGRELSGVLFGLAALSLRMPEAAETLEAQIRGALALAADVTTGPTDAAALRAAICAQIERRHGEPGLSAAPLAAAFGLTERRLHALFEGTGRPVGARIEAARLATARRLLETTDLPISAVARRAGFRDPGYCARVFRRAHGLGPRDWRAAQSS